MNNTTAPTRLLTQAKLGAGFAAISLIVIIAALGYFFQVLQPRLEQEAQDQATLLVNTLAQPLAKYEVLSDAYQTNLATSLLLLYNDHNQQPFLLGVEITFNPDVINRPSNFEGQACSDCFKVTMPLFDQQDARLLADGHFWVNAFNHQQLISDLKEKLMITLVTMLLLLAGFWWLLRGLLQQLINAQQHNQTVLNSIEDALLMVDSRGHVIDQNPFASLIFGPGQYTLDQLITTQDGQAIKPLLQSKANHPIEVRFKTGGMTGEVALMTISRMPPSQLNNRPAFIVLIKNIQSLRSAQAELKHQMELAHLSRLRTLGEMASGIAHEVKQPLAVIRLGVEGLQEIHQQAWSSSQSQLAQDLNQTLLEQVNRADRIVRNIRSFAKLEHAPSQWVKVPQVVESAVGFIKQAYPLDQINIVEDIDYAVPMIFVEYHKLEQLLVNLITNAIDSIQHQQLNEQNAESPWIKISLFQQHNQLVLAVKDNGCGMTAEQQAQCLMPFYTTKHKSEGVGIGLAIVKTIVDVYGAELLIESAPQQGSCFTIRFNLPTSPIIGDDHA